MISDALDAQLNAWLGDVLGLPESMLWSAPGTLSMGRGEQQFSGIVEYRHVDRPGQHVLVNSALTPSELHALESALLSGALASPRWWQDLDGESWEVAWTRDHVICRPDPSGVPRDASAQFWHSSDVPAGPWDDLELARATRVLGLGDPQSPTAVAALHGRLDGLAHLGIWVAEQHRRRGDATLVAQTALVHVANVEGAVRGCVSTPAARALAATLGFEYGVTESLLVRSESPW